MVVRIFFCAALFVAFAFWEDFNFGRSNDIQSEFQVDHDLGIRWTSWWYQMMLEHRDQVPIVAAHVLACLYILAVALFYRYVTAGDFIFPAILLSWLLALGLTTITALPVSTTAIGFNVAAFPLEKFVTDTTVSWHTMLLVTCISVMWDSYPFKVMIPLWASVSVLVVGFLMATRRAYTISVVLGITCGAAGLWLQTRLRRWYETPTVKRDDDNDVEMIFTLDDEVEIKDS